MDRSETYFGQDRRCPFGGRLTSADAEASYIAVKLLAPSLTEAGTDEFCAVKTAVARLKLSAPQGGVWVDPDTMHLYLTPRIGPSHSGGLFDIIMEEPQPTRPAPYLVRSLPIDGPASSRLVPILTSSYRSCLTAWK